MNACSGRRLLLALLLALAAAPALAGLTLQEIEQHVRRGRRHVQQFDYDAAISAFGKVTDAHRDGEIDPAMPGARRLLVYALEGMAEARLGLGDRDGAARQFEAALAIDPAFEPNRDRHSPKLIAIFDEVRGRSAGTLTVESTPSGGRVLLDGQEHGVTPVTLRNVSIGRHRLEVFGTPGGRWSGAVEVRPAEVMHLVAALRPGLAYLGLAATADVAPEALRDARRLMNDAVSRMQRYDRIVAGPGEGGEHARVLLVTSPGDSPQVRDAAVRDVASQLAADLVLVGVVRLEQSRPVADLRLYSAWHGAPDVLTVHLDRPADLEHLVRAMGRRPELTEPQLGMRVVGTRQPGHAIRVVDLHPGGPASEAGLRVGDGIVEWNGVELTSLADWRRALAAVRPDDGRQDGTLVTLTVRRGATDDIGVHVSWGPKMLHPGDPEVLYNQQLVELLYEPDDPDSPHARDVTRLNQAMAYVHFGRCDLALDRGLSTAGLPEGAGISGGTVDYWRGWCYEQLGPEYQREARRGFETAAAAARATLYGESGPLAAPLARQHLEALP